MLNTFNLYSKLLSLFTFFKLDGFVYIRGLLFIFLIDSLLLDDEPLWEPLEWSLVQTWILFIFVFAWAAEVIFSSRFGSYTNRDKKVWLGLHKVFWLIEFWFMINLGIVTVFITLPFYFEITYTISYIVLWWNWYNSFFFFKFIFTFSLLKLLLNTIYYFVRWINLNFFVFLLVFFLTFFFYFLFFLFYFLFFLFFTDSNLYSQNGWVDYSNITHGPLKWNWGLQGSDHFSYHKTPETFWYKNDPLIASSMLLLNLFLFLFLFLFVIKLLVFIRVTYTSNNISFNFFTFFASSFNQFFYFFLFIFIFNLTSLLLIILRSPFDLYWFVKIVKIFEIWGLLIVDILHLIY